MADVDSELVSIWKRASDHVTKLDTITDLDVRAAQLHAIEADVATLRERAGLDPTTRTEPSAIPMLDPGTAISIAGADIASGDVSSFDPEIVGTVRRGPVDVDFAIRPNEVRTASRPREAVLARPSGSWFVWSLDPETFRTNDRHAVATYDVLRPLIPHSALDAGTLRAVVWGQRRYFDQPPVIALSTDDGVSWNLISAPSTTRFVGATQDWSTGTIDVFVRHVDQIFMSRITAESLATIASTRKFPKFRLLGSWRWNERIATRLEGTRRVDCRSGDTIWIAGVDDLHRHRFDDSQSFLLDRRRVIDPIAQVACNEEIAVAIRRDPEVLYRCVAGGCGPVLELNGRARGAVRLLADGTWLYAAALDGVIGVWRESKRPRFYRIANPGDVHGIPLIDGQLHVAISTRDGYRFVRLPNQK